MRYLRFVALSALALLLNPPDGIAADVPPTYRSHPPMRPLPVPSHRPLVSGPARFVDPTKGSDQGEGTEQSSWRTIQYACKQLRPGDTLYLRGGTYFERLVLRKLTGKKNKPITLRSYPGELVTIDGGYREFVEKPETAWEPCPGGPAGEFRSTKTYPELAEETGGVHWHEGKPEHARLHLGPRPAAGEALGVHRGLLGSGYFSNAVKVLGNFADSMVPLHGYYNLADLPTDDPQVGKRKPEDLGPRVWYDMKTQRIHIRLEHTRQEHLGAGNYRGETDPRKLPLVVGGPRVAVHVEACNHLRLQDLVLRGSRSRTLNLESCADIELDHVTVYGGAPALHAQSTQGLRLYHSALRGLCAPWSTRSSEKYHGISCYLFVADGTEPQNSDMEIAWCEVTDNHDGLIIGSINSLRFHHNYFDNFNDDGLYLTTEMPAGKDVQIFQNYLSRSLSTLAFAGPGKDQQGKEAFLFRNVLDLRGPMNGPNGFVHGRTCGDHGGPIWKPLLCYQNTVLLPEAVWRNYYAGGLARSVRDSRRWHLNNIFYYVKGAPGFHLEVAGEQVADGNLHWSAEIGPSFQGDFLAKARVPARKQPNWFEASKKSYPPGWTAHDLFADPRFVRLSPSWGEPLDLRLQPKSPAIDAGVDVPRAWPDPLREKEKGRPDIGAFPLGVEPWRIGIDGRFTAFGLPAAK